MMTRAWFLLLAPPNVTQIMGRRFFALPCNTLDDLAEQIALHRRARTPEIVAELLRSPTPA